MKTQARPKDENPKEPQSLDYAGSAATAGDALGAEFLSNWGRGENFVAIDLAEVQRKVDAYAVSVKAPLFGPLVVF